MNTQNTAIKPQKRWQRTESRTIRPIHYSEDLLHNTAIRLKETEDFIDNVDSIQRDEIDLAELSPELLFRFSVEDVESQLGLDPDLLRLLVSIEDKALKKTVLAHTCRFDEEFESQILIPKDIVDSLSWSGDTKINIAVVLADDRNASVGQASHAGQWLAMKTISVIRERNSATFPIEVVNGEVFVAKGLPPDTTYYVEIVSDLFNDPASAMNDLVRIYVNESINPTLDKAKDNSAGRALLLNMYCDAAASILEAGYAPLESASEIEEGSILKTVTDKLSASTGISPENIFKLSKDLGGSSRLRALLQSECGLSRTLSSATFNKVI